MTNSKAAKILGYNPARDLKTLKALAKVRLSTVNNPSLELRIALDTLINS